MSAPPSRRLYLGRLPQGATREELERFFQFNDRAKITDVRLNGAYGFIEFEDIADAEDAVRELNGRDFMGERMVIEFAKQPRSFDGPPRPRNPPAPRGYRLDIVGFGEGTSWQDLKDFARSAGSSVSYADVSRTRHDEGVIEYQNARDVEEAFRKLDGAELNGRPVRLYEQRPPPQRRRSPSPRRRSPSPRRRDYDDRDRGDRYERRRSRSPRRDY